METVAIHPVAQYVFSFIKMKETSEYQLAKTADFSHVTFTNWRKGKVPSTKILEKIQKVYPDFNRNGYTTERKEDLYFANVPYLATEQEKEVVFWKQKTNELQEELNLIKNKLEQANSVILNLSTALGKHESMTESLLIDSERGVSLMNAILGSKAGHALSKRMQ